MEERAELDKLPDWGNEKEMDLELRRAMLAKVFTVQNPKQNHISKHETVVNWAQNLAMVIFEFCPESVEREDALKRLQECVMWANEAISRS